MNWKDYGATGCLEKDKDQFEERFATTTKFQGDCRRDWCVSDEEDFKKVKKSIPEYLKQKRYLTKLHDSDSPSSLKTGYLNVDMGLYHKFNVHPKTGKPEGS